MPRLNWNWLAAILFGASYAALVPGLVLPLVLVESAGGAYRRSQSTLQVISDMMRWGYYSPGFMIMFFSVILPIVKLVLLLRLAWSGSLKSRQSLMLRRISKFQCVDVYVGMVMLSLSSSMLTVTPQLGALFFGMFSMFSLTGTQIISHGASAAWAPSCCRCGLALALLRSAGLAAGVAWACLRPVIIVRQRWGFVAVEQVDPSLLDVLHWVWRIAGAPVAIVAALLVLVLPSLQALLALVAHFQGQGRASAAAGALWEWSMLDVLAIGVVVAMFSLNSWDSMDPMAPAGTFVLMATGGLSCHIGYHAAFPTDQPADPYARLQVAGARPAVEGAVVGRPAECDLDAHGTADGGEAPPRAGAAAASGALGAARCRHASLLAAAAGVLGVASLRRSAVLELAEWVGRLQAQLPELQDALRENLPATVGDCVAAGASGAGSPCSEMEFNGSVAGLPLLVSWAGNFRTIRLAAVELQGPPGTAHRKKLSARMSGEGARVALNFAGSIGSFNISLYLGGDHLDWGWRDIDWVLRLSGGCYANMPFFRGVGASMGISHMPVRLPMRTLNRALSNSLGPLRHLMDPALPEVMGDCSKAPPKRRCLENGSIYAGKAGIATVAVHYVEGIDTMRISSASFRVNSSELFFDFVGDWEEIKLTVKSHALKFPQEWKNLPWRLSIINNCSSDELPHVVSVHVGEMPMKIKVFGIPSRVGIDISESFAERLRYNVDFALWNGSIAMPCARGTDFVELNVSAMLAHAVQDHLDTFLIEESIEWQGRVWTLPGLFNRFAEVEASGFGLRC